MGANAAGTPTDLLATLRAAGVGFVGGTVIRTHVWLSLAAIDTDVNPSFIWGLIVWDKSLASVNEPPILTDFYSDWVMLRQISPGTADNAVNTPANSPTTTLYGQEYDVKSRRRLHEMNDSYFFYVGNQGSTAENYSMFTRTLIALP